MANFDKTILKELEGCFAEGTIETLVRWTEGPEPNWAVRVIHSESGKTGTSDVFESQIKNKALALVRLLKEL